MQHVERFFTALSTARLPAARALVAPGFMWFGRALAPDDWSTGPFSQFISASQLTASQMRVVPEDLLAARAPRPYTPKLEGAPLVLADVTRGADTVTVAIEVDAAKKDGLLLQVFDPGGIREYLLALGAPEATR